MGFMDKEHRVQKEKSSMEDEGRNHILELMYKLDLSCTKVEQCAFDSINTTDQVMLSMQNVMETLQKIISQQAELHNAMELCTLSLEEKEAENLMQLAKEQTKAIEELEIELHKVAEAAIEANDAARCIEAGIAEQSEVVSELIQCNEECFCE